MLAALLTAFLFSLSAVCGRRLAVVIGGLQANTTRLALAFGLLLAIVFMLGGWTGGTEAFRWLVISGVIGFGVGDVALYLSLVRIGSRLTTLLVFCIGPLLGAMIEFGWLGVRVSVGEIVAIVTVLIGVALVLSRSGKEPRTDISKRRRSGYIWGIVAGVGQAVGAVFTRRANEVFETRVGEASGIVDGLSQAMVRVGAGLPIGIAALLIASFAVRRGQNVKEDSGSAVKLSRKSLVAWLVAAATCGPVFGVGCFQLALMSVQSAVVLAVVALTPIFVMPWAFLLERDRPTLRALLGTVIAVSGVIWLALGS